MPNLSLPRLLAGILDVRPLDLRHLLLRKEKSPLNLWQIGEKQFPFFLIFLSIVFTSKYLLFRTLGETKVGTTHSSQDSLSSSRKASREYDSAFTSRRPSKEVSDEFPSNSRRSSRGSESIADTIKDIENRVAYMSDIVTRHTEEKMMKANVDDEKWSTLEKKYIFKDQQDQSNERPKGKLATLRLGQM